uniref:G_PROTEIN_RECEP_F1_2 domain-containing protein n=1 Tax=Heterorhabditis bacteriophora TaxID=37862 RepID=A0A1I7X0G0_HETBA
MTVLNLWMSIDRWVTVFHALHYERYSDRNIVPCITFPCFILTLIFSAWLSNITFGSNTVLMIIFITCDLLGVTISLWIRHNAKRAERVHCSTLGLRLSLGVIYLLIAQRSTIGLRWKGAEEKTLKEFRRTKDEEADKAYTAEPLMVQPLSKEYCILDKVNRPDLKYGTPFF